MLGLKLANQFDRREIGSAFFFRRTGANIIRSGNPVIFGVANWRIADYSLTSGGRRMYSSRTISQARSWACCAVIPCR